MEKADKIIKIQKENITLENGRVVMKIEVKKLKIFDKPLLLDGILYIRERDNTKTVTSFQKDLPIYEDRQMYIYYTKGIESNLRKLEEQRERESFQLDQFIEGLKVHIKSVIKENKITGNEKKLRDAENLLDQIKQKISASESRLSQESPPISSSKHLDQLIQDFIGIYKNIIGEI